MNLVKDYTIDKTSWPRGEWDNEGDKYSWDSFGFDCLLVRNQWGAWCGYIGIPPSHKWHGQYYDDIEVRVHGGLTYSEGEPPANTDPGAKQKWWIGFDCSHAGDITPGLGFRPFPGDTYKDKSYAAINVNLLAMQAKMNV